MSIDYSDAGESGFKIDNPNEPPRVKQLSVQELAQMRERGEAFELIDVRTEQEHGTASIEGARLLDDAGRGELLRLDKDTPLVFLCHHGQRSQAAAETFLQQGFTRVFNVRGGIDAWSREVDSSVPRY
ncbi:MAG: rhodanese-like domain-containing protein [Myxococcales bacterium]|nr:rhodanese-like domain-containing protein [Myxococcales bacterium]MDD9967629.1 rhodanese-like domain-containing protein [Myxococcales bacterium]